MSDVERRVVIVGASAAGLRCACRLRRLRPTWQVTVVDKGEVISLAACGLPYALSGDIDDPQELRRTGDGVLRDAGYFDLVKGIEVLTETSARSLDVTERTLTVETGEGERRLRWDELVLATGARPRRLPGQPSHPRVGCFHGLDDLTPLHESLARGQVGSVAIVGAGFIGCELAEAFASMWGAEVTLIEAAPHPLPGMLDAEIGGVARRALEAEDVRVLCGEPVSGIEADDEGVTVRVGEESVRADHAVVALGVAPEVGLAEAAGAEIGDLGAIVVDDRMATSVPNVWAAGDCVQVRHAVNGEAVHLPLGSLANRQGRALANVLAGGEDRFPAVAGAMVVKLFEESAAAVGLTRSAAEKLGIDARAAWSCPRDRADYWPEAAEVTIQLLWEAGTGRVLGVQAAGPGDAVRRVDVATQLIARGATLEDLAQIEHAYSPPFSAALDPLAILAGVALNQEAGLDATTPLLTLEGARVLDVRHDHEREERPCPGGQVTAVPLDRLRAEVAGLEREDWLVVCERGPRSAEAARVLGVHGIPARFLGGGLRLRHLAGGGEGK